MNPEISIIICTYNRERYIGEAIQKIIDQQVNGKVEIVVVNNNSTDSTHRICTCLLEKYPGSFLYFIEENQGLSFARNRGIAESSGEILAFIDDDAMAEPDFAEKLISFYKNNPEIAATGGRIYPLYESKEPAWMSHFLRPLMSVIDLGDEPKPLTGKMYPIGANMAVRKSAIAKTGNFNTSLGRTGKKMLGGEEKDLFFRIRKLGMTVSYVPDAVVRHVVPDARLNADFIRKQGRGIGKSEFIRTSTEGKLPLFKAYITELLKWGATLLLFLRYLITFSPSKGIMLVRFRFWVSQGLFIRSTVI